MRGCSRCHLLNKKYRLFILMRASHVFECHLYVTSRELVTWNFICARWSLCIKFRVVFYHRCQNRSRLTLKGRRLDPTCKFAWLNWEGVGIQRVFNWWSQLQVQYSSELFLHAPFPRHWEFTLTAKVILYLCGECDVYECSVPQWILVCVSDRLVWLSMISKVYRNRLFLSDKLCW